VGWKAEHGNCVAIFAADLGCDREATPFEYLFAIEIKAIAATK
jgi:hypothetical protein